MEEPVTHLKYEKYKRLVKLWEREFKQKNGRTPSKHDIRDAKHIRDAYKMYYKLKSSFLEDTLSQSLDEDGFDLPFDTSSQFEFGSTISLSELSTISDSTGGNCSLPFSSINQTTTSNASSLENSRNFSNLHEIDSTSLVNLKNRDENHVITQFEAEHMDKINETAWGPAVSNKKSAGANAVSSTTADKTRQLVTEKLFRNASFTKRNPRKSLSRTISQTSTVTSTLASSAEQLPDLETILAQKSVQQRENAIKRSISIPTSIASNFNVDKLWLDRCAPSDNTTESADVNQCSSDSVPNKFGISNLNTSTLNSLKELAVHHIAATSQSHEVTQYDGRDEEVIANSEDESATKNDDFTTLRHVLKKRRLDSANEFNLKRSQSLNSKQTATVQPQQQHMRQSPRKTAKPTTKLPVILETPTVSELKTKKPTKYRPQTKPIGGVVRRSARTRTKATYCNSTAGDGNESEEDAFAGDNSDVDPDFDQTNAAAKSVAELTDNDDSPTKPTKTKTTKKIGKKSTTKSAKQRRARHEDPVSDGQSSTKVDYVFEFGTEIRNVPQINMNELRKTNEMFESYLVGVPTDHETTGNTTTSTANKKPGKSTTLKSDREKFEAKIDQGKLNENFVRINIQKKKFVRGKKTVNYSKYKKSQWKNKKAAAAALAGPDMDMRGCDGGYQTCFQCGKRGHFAQNCPVQCDRLLPLDAATNDIDDSAFPTLDEVEAMASAKALSVHGNKPGRLPAIANTVWKEDSENMEIDDGTKAMKIESSAVQSIEPAKKQYIGHRIPEEFLQKSGLLEQPTVMNSESLQPLYTLAENNELLATPPAEVYEALHMFGHKTFRKGQDRAIMRVLSGMSTLVTLSTGSGKSLCYQLPAYLYRKHRKCITLVVSPLVSLMEDQVHGVPHFLNAQCLHTSQSKQKREQTMDMIRSGTVDVLLISPEAIMAGEKSTGFGSLLRELPPIAFVCIDEAHCVSQWSHNFRPSYLMICRVLKEKLKVRTVLGLTATATLPTRESIVRHLAIPDGLAGVISDTPLPDNLILTVSKDENRDMALINLLSEEKFRNFQSIIVYCTRRDECDRVANKIRTCFQSDQFKLNAEAAATRKRKRPQQIVEAYHAGLGASRRKTIQNQFMNGSLKIVVATIAFGMGINKADIRAVIHYNMPMTFEGYVQEVGRAGRDGEPAHCHLFLDSRGGDKTELRRHIYANSIDRHVIRKLLRNIFVPCACVQNARQNKEFDAELDAVREINWSDDYNDDPSVKDAAEKSVTQRKCPGHEIGFSEEETVQQLDIPVENISTLLCYMELHPKRFIQVLSKAYRMCKVMSYGGAKQLKKSAQNCPPLAMAIALDLKKGISHADSTFIEFGVIEIASAIGWDSGVVKYQLKNLEWTTANGLPKRSNISVEFYDLAFRVRSPGDLSDEELDSTLDILQTRVVEQEKTQLRQLQTVFNGLSSVAYNSISAINVKYNERSNKLKHLIRNYFQSGQLIDIDLDADNDDDALDQTPTAQLLQDVRTMIVRYPENKFTGRAIARIFHGVQSPVYPALVWSRCSFWRGHQKTDFNRIVSLANSEIVKMRS